MKQSKAYRLHFALQLYDTSSPRLAVRECERLAGLKHPALQNALKRRKLKHAMFCPTCGRTPGEKISLVKAEKLKRKAERLRAKQNPT